MCFSPQGDFREDNFNTAMQVLRDAGDSGGSGGGKWDPRGRKGGTKGLFASSLTDSIKITYVRHVIMSDAWRNFHRSIQCV